MSFYGRKPYKLRLPKKSNSHNCIIYTNVNDYKWTIFSLSKAGFGSVSDLENMCLEDYLDLTEYLQITNEIQDCNNQN